MEYNKRNIRNKSYSFPKDCSEKQWQQINTIKIPLQAIKFVGVVYSFLDYTGNINTSF